MARGSHTVLGIDAAWTLTQPSGVALLESRGDSWRLVAASASYTEYATGYSAGAAASAEALLEASEVRCGQRPSIVAVDMPLAKSAIVTRREADNAVSRQYGARHCSTHSPSAVRPGPISDQFRVDFAGQGYALAVSEVNPPALIEVYPHPALVELARAARRLPYKAGKMRSYWPNLSSPERRVRLYQIWGEIIALLDTEIMGVADQLQLPDMQASGRELKAFEDRLDAVVCAWVGLCVLEGGAAPFGDAESAIWIPKPRL